MTVDEPLKNQKGVILEQQNHPDGTGSLFANGAPQFLAFGERVGESSGRVRV